MKIYIIIFLSSFFFFIESCNKDDGNIEIYFTARNVKRGYYDNGIFNYELNRKSIKVRYEDRSYESIVRSDSVYELYYLDTNISKKICNYYNNIERVYCDSFWTERAMIVFSDKKDTILIDRNFTACSKNKKDCFILSSSLRNAILQLLPPDLKRSWINDMPPRLNSNPSN